MQDTMFIFFHVACEGPEEEKFLAIKKRKISSPPLHPHAAPSSLLMLSWQAL